MLEIGCGSSSRVRTYCQQIGAIWEAIDVQNHYYGKPTVATRIESVADLSFPDESFDLVIGTQTMEHWNEFGCRVELGLWQCFRGCKKEGRVLMDFLIHFHGSRIFVEGNIEAIRNLFRPFAARIEMISWGRHRAPLARIEMLPSWVTSSSEGAYQLEVRAQKGPCLPPEPSGYRFRHRAIRELSDHRSSYLLWKVARRLSMKKSQRT